MKKGIIFTLDVTLAVLLTLSIITASLFYLSQINLSFEDEELYRLTMDSLAVLEKSNALSESASTGSTQPINYLLESLPYNTCAKVELYDKNNVRILTVKKVGCTYSDDYLLSRRVFIAQDEIYLAKMEAWFK